MMETAIILSQHFSKERQLHGLYGLYPKYRPYVHVVGCFLLTIGHGLCFATLQIDAGTPSDLRTVFFLLKIPSLTEWWMIFKLKCELNF